MGLGGGVCRRGWLFSLRGGGIGGLSDGAPVLLKLFKCASSVQRKSCKRTMSILHSDLINKKKLITLKSSASEKKVEYAK